MLEISSYQLIRSKLSEEGWTVNSRNVVNKKNLEEGNRPIKRKTYE